MCRNIRTLYNFEPCATDAEIRASALQFVRKVSGFAKPSKTNEASFNRAVEQVTATVQELFESLVTTAPPRDREVEAARARARSLQRFGQPQVHSHVDEHGNVYSHSHDHEHPRDLTSQ